jgi:hypothetical protein
MSNYPLIPDTEAYETSHSAHSRRSPPQLGVKGLAALLAARGGVHLAAAGVVSTASEQRWPITDIVARPGAKLPAVTGMALPKAVSLPLGGIVADVLEGARDGCGHSGLLHAADSGLTLRIITTHAARLAACGALSSMLAWGATDRRARHCTY